MAQNYIVSSVSPELTNRLLAMPKAEIQSKVDNG